MQYCAPETLSGCFDETSDSFSAMAVMYHMVTGVVPWDAQLTAGMPYPARKRAVRAARKQPIDLHELERKGLSKRDIDLMTEGLAFDSRVRLTVSDLLKYMTGEFPFLPHRQTLLRTSSLSELSLRQRSREFLPEALTYVHRHPSWKTEELTLPSCT